MLEVLENQAGAVIRAVIALYIVVNPSGVSSIFLAVTKRAPPGVRFTIALRAAITGAILLAAFAFVGNFIFDLFHVTRDAFQIAGGIFVFGVAFALARGKEGEFFGKMDEIHEAGAHGSVAFYPLAVPLIAGPASITVVMTLTAKQAAAEADVQGSVVVIIAIAVVCALALLSMLRVLKLAEKVGPGLSLILPPLMGLVLAVIAIQSIIDGLTNLLPGFTDAVKKAIDAWEAANPTPQ